MPDSITSCARLHVQIGLFLATQVERIESTPAARHAAISSGNQSLPGPGRNCQTSIPWSMNPMQLSHDHWNPLFANFRGSKFTSTRVFQASKSCDARRESCRPA